MEITKEETFSKQKEQRRLRMSPLLFLFGDDLRFSSTQPLKWPSIIAANPMRQQYGEKKNNLPFFNKPIRIISAVRPTTAEEKNPEINARRAEGLSVSDARSC